MFLVPVASSLHLLSVLVHISTRRHKPGAFQGWRVVLTLLPGITLAPFPNADSLRLMDIDLPNRGLIMIRLDLIGLVTTMAVGIAITATLPFHLLFRTLG